MSVILPGVSLKQPLLKYFLSPYLGKDQLLWDLGMNWRELENKTLVDNKVNDNMNGEKKYCTFLFFGILLPFTYQFIKGWWRNVQGVDQKITRSRSRYYFKYKQ